jgi:hypothetical protein
VFLFDPLPNWMDLVMNPEDIAALANALAQQTAINQAQI